MNPIESYIMDYYISNQPFPANQIKHFKTLNPAYYATGNNLFGTSPLQPYIYSMDILKNVDREVDKQVKNSGQLGILSPKNKEDNWGDQQIDDLHDSLKTAHKSKRRLDRYVPVSVPVEWTKIGLTPEELQALQVSDAKADDIYRGYHIPLQFRNQDTATYNNLPVANRQLIYNAVAPVCRRFGIGVTEFIAKPYNTTQAKYIIEKDFTGLPEMMDDMKTTAQALQLIDFLTKNEKREVLRYGRLPARGMDDVWVNINQVSLSDIASGKVVQGHGAAVPENTPPADPNADAPAK